MRYFNLLFFIFFIFQSKHGSGQELYPGTAPGKAVVKRTGNIISLENNSLRLEFDVMKHQIHPAYFIDKIHQDKMDLHSDNWFTISMKNGTTISNKDFELKASPVIKEFLLNPHSAKYSDHLKGKIISVTLINKSLSLSIDWEAQLNDGSNYILQRWAFHCKDSLPIIQYSMLEIASDSAKQMGTVDGTPLVSRQMFFALEHPMSKNEIHSEKAISYLSREKDLQPSDSLVITTVFGVVPKGQLRRGFLYYLERERSHPYRPFLHYNSWYDLSWIDRKMEENSCLDRIKMYGDSLVKKRHVKMKAFLFDDGWDNNSSLWQVSQNFPGGFTKMKDLAESYGAELGLWLSPWGGYGESQEERLKYGRLQTPPFETNENGFSLAGRIYFKRFEKVTSDFILKDKVAIFKFDGVGAGNGASGSGLKYQNDIDALLSLTQKLKTINPDLYLSLTVGTWPSVYWLFYGDAIWRAGSDFGYAASGSKRQQWISYRDGESYKNIVKRAPLFPLNSVMLHGICISDAGYPKALEMDIKSISDDIWAFFASGTSLQEMYINPHLMTAEMWNCLAKAAKWSAENSKILKDVHWIGGDPEKEEVYGYASWAPQKGIFSLRNPSSVTKTFKVNLKEIFELPGHLSPVFKLKNVINQDGSKDITTRTDQTISINLEPYQIKIWEALPVKE